MDGPANEQLAARLRLVEEHVRRENAHDLAGIMATFGDEAEYDDAPWGEQHAGRAAVQQYYQDLLAALPDLHIDVQNRWATADAVVLEVLISGTQAGTWRGLPATGRPVRFPLCAIYRFAANGMLIGEKIYYDRAGVLHQIGLYHEPVGVFGRLVTSLTHPLTLARAYGRMLIPRPAVGIVRLPTEHQTAEDARMGNGRLSRGGWLAVGLAILGSVVAFINEWIAYRRSGTVDWGHVALAVGVPLLMYAIVRNAAARRP